MRYESAVELARTVMERAGTDGSRFEAVKNDTPVLADHDDPVYELYFRLAGTEIPGYVGELATYDDIRVEIDDDDAERLRLSWASPVDDVFSYRGNLGRHKYDQPVHGTIRKYRTDVHGEDPDRVKATFTTAEKGTLYRVELEAKRTDMTWQGETYKEVAYRLYVGGKERITHSEEMLVEESPEELIAAFTPDDEDLPHTAFRDAATQTTTA